MAEQASSSTTIAAAPEQVLAVISDLHAYPEWTGQITSAEVVDTYPDGRPKRATFGMSASGFTDEYTLDYTYAPGEVSWTLVEPTKLQKSQVGSYRVAATGGGSEVTYLLTLESKIPMIGPMKRKANKMIIDAALKELKRGWSRSGRRGAEAHPVASRPPDRPGGELCASCCSPARVVSARRPSPRPPRPWPLRAGTRSWSSRPTRRTRSPTRSASASVRSRRRSTPACRRCRSTRRRAFERSWRDVQRYLRGGARAGRRRRAAGRGAHRAARRGGGARAARGARARSPTGPWDLVVVDCAPTGETLRLLALPEALRWYVERVFPAQRRALRAVRPLLHRVAGPSVPEDDLFDAVEVLHRELAGVRAALTDPGATVRVVLTPEEVVVAEARRTLTSLALYGYRVDGLVANRVFPTGSDDPWLAGWAQAQAAQLEGLRADAGGLPVALSPYRGSEPVGLEALTRARRGAVRRRRPGRAGRRGGGPGAGGPHVRRLRALAGAAARPVGRPRPGPQRRRARRHRRRPPAGARAAERAVPLHRRGRCARRRPAAGALRARPRPVARQLPVPVKDASGRRPRRRRGCSSRPSSGRATARRTCSTTSTSPPAPRSAPPARSARRSARCATCGPRPSSTCSTRPPRCWRPCRPPSSRRPRLLAPAAGSMHIDVTEGQQWD